MQTPDSAGGVPGSPSVQKTNVFEAPRKIWLEYVRSSLEKRSEPWGGANEVHLPNKTVSSIH